MRCKMGQMWLRPYYLPTNALQYPSVFLVYLNISSLVLIYHHSNVTSPIGKWILEIFLFLKNFIILRTIYSTLCDGLYSILAILRYSLFIFIRIIFCFTMQRYEFFLEYPNVFQYFL